MHVEPGFQFQAGAVPAGQPVRHHFRHPGMPSARAVLVLAVGEDHPDDGSRGREGGAGRQVDRGLGARGVPRQYVVEPGDGRAGGVENGGAHGDPYAVCEPPMQLLDLWPVQGTATNTRWE